MNPILFLSAQSWVERLGWTLVHFIWQGAAIAVVFLVLRQFVLNRAAPNVRYFTACIALAIMALSPVVTFSWMQVKPPDALASPNVAASNVPILPKHAVSAAAHVGPGDFYYNAFPLIVLVWFAGVIAFSLRLFGGWAVSDRLCSIGTEALPEWDQRFGGLCIRMGLVRPVRLLKSAEIAVPTLIGILRPVILIPVAALAGLPTEHLEALLLHELAHVRRSDYLANILQSVIEALLFYHPAVWWVSRQIRIERELCCDDLAVSFSGDVLVYAQALAQLEEMRATPIAALSAGGASLKDRIARLLGVPARRRPILPSFAGASMGLFTIFVVVAVTTVFGQNGAVDRFNELSISLNRHDGHDVLMPGEVRFLSRGLMLAGWVNVRTLVEQAYNVKPFEVGEGPDWMDSVRYDIEAHARPDATADEMRLMLQQLLADTYKLKIHREPEDRPTYVMTPGPGGYKTSATQTGGCRIPDPNQYLPPPPPPPSVFTSSAWVTPMPTCGRFVLNVKSLSEARLQAGYVTMTDFAHYLSNLFGSPVIDQTGYKTNFDIYLSFVPNGTIESLRASLIVAVRDQLGVQIAPAKGPLDVLVVDHVEKPAINR